MTPDLDDKIIAAIRAGSCRFGTIGSRVGAVDRVLDRALQRLRRAGKIACKGTLWSIIEDRAAPPHAGDDAAFVFAARHWLAFIEEHPHRSGNDEAMMVALRRFLDEPTAHTGDETITLHVTRPADPELTCMGCKGGNCDGEMHMRLGGTTAAIGFHDRCKPRAVHPAPLPADVHAAAREAMDRVARSIDCGPNGSGYPICSHCGAVWMKDKPEPDDGHGERCPIPVLARAVLARPASTPESPPDIVLTEEGTRLLLEWSDNPRENPALRKLLAGVAASEGVRVEGVVQSFDRAFGILVIKTHDNIDPLFVESLEPRVTVTPLPPPDGRK